MGDLAEPEDNVVSIHEFTVTVEVSRVSGKFATRDEITDALREGIEQGANDADVYGLGPDGESEYQIDDVNIEEVEPRKGKVPYRVLELSESETTYLANVLRNQRRNHADKLRERLS